MGRGAHALSLKTGLELTPFLATALISMYSKCGSIDSATLLFQQTPENTKSLHVWNAILYGLASHGHGNDALRLFNNMISSGSHQPDSVMFIGLLSGCANSGLVQEGKLYFKYMTAKFGIEPTVKHYGCMVNLLGRAGLLDEAFDLVTHMPMQPNYVIWLSLLRSCCAHGNLPLAEQVMARIRDKEIESQIKDASPFFILSAMYRKAGVLDKYAWLRYRLDRNPEGKSWAEIGGKRHEFSEGFLGLDCTVQTEIMEVLDELDVKLGKEREETNAEHHSEKIAVAYGLIKSKSGPPIRVFKKLRICKDCHDWMKFVSKSYEREIVMRDINRFHRFVGGICTCRDFW